MRTATISVAFQTDKPPGAYARLAATAEALGFDGVSTFHDLGYQPSLPALLEMAAATTRVRLGAAGLNPTLTHPYEIAGQVAALDAASRGRAYLGLVRGAWLDRVGAADADRPLQRLEEAVAVVRRLLAGDDRGYDGRTYRLAPGFRLAYRRQRAGVDVLLGTWGPKGTVLAGRVAEELKLGGSANPDLVRLVRARLDDAAATAGRDPAAVGLVAGAVTVVDEDGAAARRRARREVAMYLDVVAGLDPTVAVEADVRARLRAALDAGDPEAAAASVPDELLGRFAFAGDPDAVAGHAAALVEAGASRIEFGTPHGLDAGRGVELLGRRVLPAVRAAFPVPAA